MIRITITGEEGAGKTSIAHDIVKALNTRGIEAALIDDDYLPVAEMKKIDAGAVVIVLKETADHALEIRDAMETITEIHNILGAVAKRIDAGEKIPVEITIDAIVRAVDLARSVKVTAVVDGGASGN